MLLFGLLELVVEGFELLLVDGRELLELGGGGLEQLLFKVLF